ncbi:MAG: NAD(P)/FAD-dependent oxidoreductase [Alkalispirochaeta sp.]
MYEVAIVGGGPAGLAAAMYCIRKGMDVQLITATLGGKSVLGLTLPDMSEYHVIKAREQVRAFQSRIEYLSHTWRKGNVTAIREEGERFVLDVSTAVTRRTDGINDGGAATGSATATSADNGSPDSAGGGTVQLESERLIIATGTTPRRFDVPGVAEFFGNALGSSAISYSHLLRERHAVVIGDSDRAIESAIELSMQCSTVSLVMEPHARYSHRHLEIASGRENVEIFNGYRLLRVEGDTFARGVVLCRGDSDHGECSPQKTLAADVFFLEREPDPNSDLVGHLVSRNSRGAIYVNERNETNHPRVFAAGDVTTVGIEQILVALGEGARAGLSAYRQHAIQI